MKRICIIVSVCLIFISCKNKNYDLLQSENRLLREKLDSLKPVDENEIRKQVVKEVLEEKIWTNGLIVNELIFYKFKPINTNKFGKENKPCFLEVDLYKYDESKGGAFKFDILIYTIPTKNKNTNIQKRIRTTDKYFTFIPKDTGMHYWSGAFVVKNDRTGRITEFLVYDSVYVLGKEE